MKLIESLIASKLDEHAQAIADKLLPKYVAEFEALLTKVSNNLLTGLAKYLVIEDKGKYLSVTIAVPESMEIKTDV